MAYAPAQLRKSRVFYVVLVCTRKLERFDPDGNFKHGIADDLQTMAPILVEHPAVVVRLIAEKSFDLSRTFHYYLRR
jgi:hypothetical protein